VSGTKCYPCVGLVKSLSSAPNLKAVPFCSKIPIQACRSLPRILGNFIRLIPDFVETIAAINAARIAGKTGNEVRVLLATREPQECLR
jgi:hypothetical protein